MIVPFVLRRRSVVRCWFGIALLAVALGTCSLNAQSPLVANGSFEDGPNAPRNWKLSGKGEWVQADGQRGERFVRATSESDPSGWQSDELTLVPETDYRLEGWLRSAHGEARLGIDLVAADGSAAQTIMAPPVREVDAWRYVAVDFKPEASRATVRFTVRGTADLDNVTVAPTAIRYIGNRDVQSDAKGRIGFWGEEKENSIAEGSRAGVHRSDPAVKRRDVPSLVVESTADWYAVSSVNYGVPGFTDRIQLSGWARTEGMAVASILACWMDDEQKVLRVDAGAEVRGTDWQKVTLTPHEPPARAHTVRLVALARGGKVWFDEFDLLHLHSPKPVLRALVNQVGYELSGPKSAVVATNFFPTDRSTLNVRIVGEGGKVALAADVACSGRIYSGAPDDWGWYFWRFDFSKLNQPGTYKVEADYGDARSESFAFVVDRGAVLKQTATAAVEFFFVQRCGCDVPGWHGPCHLDDARLADGTHVDVTGGWHSAGDYNKPMWQFGDSGASYALATAAAAQPELFGARNRDASGLGDAWDEALWGGKFLAKMQNPSDGSLRGDVMQGPARTWMRWEAPDKHTDNKVGTADDPVIAPAPSNAPLTIAAWACLARELDARGVQNDYIERAERLWSFLTSSDSAVTNPLLLIGALEMHRTTKDEKYRQFARLGATAILKLQKANGSFPGDTGDHGDGAAAALALFGLQYGDDPLAGSLRSSLVRYLDFCIARTNNPFGLTRQGAEEPEATFFHPTVGMGVNFWILSRAWSALLVYQLTHDERAIVYATDQIDWVLGKNPLGLCMFEGLGGLNPPRYHHRYNMIAGRERGAVPGAIPNGIVRDMGIADRPGFDMSRAGGRSPSFRTSEPWLVHNMFFLLATSALEKNVISDSPGR